MKLCKKNYKFFVTTILVVSLPVLSACSSSRQTDNLQDTTAYENVTPDITAGFLPSGTIAASTDTSEGAETDTTTADADTSTSTKADESDTLSYDDSEYTAKLTLNGSSVSASGKNLNINGTIVTITAGGTYYVSGKLDEGQLIIDAADDKKVTLVFDNVEISNSTSSCIHVKNTKKLNVILSDNSTNIINCTAALDSETSETDAAFYSKEDVVLKGSGKLTITSGYNGITSKDSLEIYSGTYEITAGNNGMKGKDNVYIENGNIIITSENDGIKSTNTDDASLGYVSIAGGNINITASGDGISAETDVTISGGTISIIAGGGSANASKASQQMPNFNHFFGQSGGNTGSSDETSCKGIKAGVNVTISAGTLIIDSADDSLHSNTNMTINGGEFTLSTGDDGMHSDTLLTINDGNINITKSYEGIESADIIINGGYISVMASDDGMNAAGGNDSSQAGGMWGGDRFQMMEGGNQSITINGGYIYINAAGDGIDSNGNINMYGGTVIVNGPTDNGNGALDYDGTFSYNGGSIIASGSSGMLQTPSASSSSVNSICITFNSAIAANSVIKIEDSDGNEILAYTSPKAYNALIIGSSLFEEGKTYKIYTNGTYTGGSEINGVYSGGNYTGTEYASLTISGSVSTYGYGGGMNPGDGMGGGGMRPGDGMGGGMRPGGMRPGGR